MKWSVLKKTYPVESEVHHVQVFHKMKCLSADTAFCFLKRFAFYFSFFVCDIHWVRSGYHNEKMKIKKEALVFILLPLEPGHSRNNCPSGWDGYFHCCLDIPDTNMYTGWICISAYLDVAYFLISNIIANRRT
jgi:hypothetical protein